MSGKTIGIASREGGTFDCYVAEPAGEAPMGHATVPAVVLASAIHGVDEDLRAIADAFAEAGFIAAAPDLFWRWLPGPIGRDDERASARSQPRGERIRAGEADMLDTLAHLRGMVRWNGRALAMGFCYGGPFAILGPKRLGFDAGMSCHGSRMQDYLAEMEGVTAPVCIVWGDADTAAPPELIEAYRAVAARMANLELRIFPGVLHGYMMPGSTKAFDLRTRDFSMGRALELLAALR
jgi:carboxymethylenebutenolidase